jgi:hypothetical protein
VKNPRTIRVNRLLGLAAVLHAVLIVLGWIQWVPFPTAWLWVAFATLWLAWPFVLILHPGRSILRLMTPLLISLPLLWRVFDEYSFHLPVALGFPLGVHLDEISDYLSARKAGGAEATHDLQNGRLAIETYGLPMPQEYAQILRARYDIEVRPIAGDTDVTAKVIGHKQGYNEVSEREINRRFGDGVIEQAAEEALKHWREKSAQNDR